MTLEALEDYDRPNSYRPEMLVT